MQMVASSQPLASQVGLEVLKRGGNAVDAAIAMAAMLNVTEPMMTGIGGDAFMLVYWSKTKELKGLNASGRAPTALSLDYFAKTKTTQMPEFGMESITVPGAFDGWVTLLEKYGTMKLADLLSPAIECAEIGFPVMEKTAEDWNAEVTKLKQTPAATVNYLIDGRAPRPGEIFRQPNLARTLRTLALGGRDAFYKGEIARAIADYCEKNFFELGGNSLLATQLVTEMREAFTMSVPLRDFFDTPTFAALSAVLETAEVVKDVPKIKPIPRDLLRRKNLIAESKGQARQNPVRRTEDSKALASGN